MAITPAHESAISAPWGEYVVGVGPLSADLFAQLPVEDGWKLELHQGRLLRMPGPGYDHAEIQARLIELINPYMRAHQLGRLVGTGCYVFSTGDVLCPDLSYVQPARLTQAPRQGSYPIVAPDLVIEIISPTDVKSKVAQKFEMYRENGVRLLWVIWPATRTIDVWRPGAPTVTLQASDTLDGADVIPGWAAPISEVFSA